MLNFSLKKLFPRQILSLTILLSITSLIQAQYFWVGGTGDWSDYENHWATTSGGTIFHSSVPTLTDDVTFDDNSFANNGEGITLTTDAICKTMDWSEATNFPFMQGSDPFILQVHGSFILNVDMTINIEDMQLLSNEAGNVINTYGNNLGLLSTMTIEGQGVWDLQSNFDGSGIYLKQGVLNTNGYDMYLTSSFRVTGSLVKELNAQNSLLNVNYWLVSGANHTLNMGTSTVRTTQFDAGNGNLQYYDIDLYHNASVMKSAQIHDLNFGETTGWSCSLTDGVTLTCDNIVGNGTRLNPLELKSSTAGQAVNLVKTTGTVDLEYVVLNDVHASGGATFNADNCIDNGNNDGWNITEPVPMDFYWVSNGGEWSEISHWATTSGGAILHTIFPTKYDNVFIDENSFSMTDQTITVDTTCMVRNITTEGVLYTPNLNSPYVEPFNVFGNCYFSDETEITIYVLRLIGSEYDISFHPSAIGYINNLQFYGGVHCTLTGDLSCGGHNINGEVYYNTNGFNIDCNSDFSTNHYPGMTTEVIFGSSEIGCRDFKVSSPTVIIDAADVTVSCERNFKGQENEYGHVILEDAGELQANNTFGVLEFLPGSNYQLDAGSVQTVLTDLVLDGTPSESILLSSSQAGQQANFVKVSGTINATYLSLQDNNAMGGAIFNTTQSIDNGNNTGWNIAEIQPQDYYWVGGIGDWSDAANHWATTSGGSTFYNFVPGALDNVYFDANSFTTDGQTVTLDIATANFHDMDWSAITNDVNFDAGSTNELNIYGSFILSENVSFVSSHYNFLTAETADIDLAGNNSFGLIAEVIFDGVGVWNLQDSISTFYMIFKGGTFNSNNYGINVVSQFKFDTENYKEVNLGTSTIFTARTFWDGPTGDNLHLNAGESDWYVDRTFTPIHSGDLNTYDINNVTFVESEDEGQIAIQGAFVNTLTIAPGRSIRFTQFVEMEVGQLIVEGTAEDPIALYSNQAGMQSTIVQASGEVNGTFLELQDMAATGGATFYANNSIDNGNNSGWIFTGTAQTISFDEIDDVMEDAAPIDLDATATSGLEVSYAIVGGPATITGNQLSITGAGQIEVQASQSGDTEYNPAPSVIHTFCAIPLQPSITGEMQDDTFLLSSSATNGNQWFLNGNQVDGASSQEYSTIDNGLYTVLVNVNGCISEESEGLQVDGISVSEIVSIDFFIYPNPVSKGSLFYIDGISTNNEIHVFDLFGKLVQQYNNRTDIPTQSLSKGVYVVKIIQGDSIGMTRLIVE